MNRGEKMTLEEQKRIADILNAVAKDGVITRKEVFEQMEKHDFAIPRFVLKNRVGRGLYAIPDPGQKVTKTKVKKVKQSQASQDLDVQMIQEKVEVKNNQANVLHSNSREELQIPEKDDLYVRTSNHKVIKDVIKSGMFYPVYVTGLSGNGKTFSIEQVCAELGRPLVRVNITSETEEDDLLGGFRLINGETKWFDGPVVLAMKQGAILLLDEVDLASSKIMCLQSALEGRGVFLKKIGAYVHTAPGFNVLATANTKGLGDDGGKFIGTNVLNEAFLERFPLWLEQEYPTKVQETKILEKLSETLGLELEKEEEVPEYIETLIRWAQQIRDGYANEVNEDIITTRRLAHILRAYKITGKAKDSVKLCLNRFNRETQEAFYTMFEQFIKLPEAEVTEAEKVDQDIDPEPLF